MKMYHILRDFDRPNPGCAGRLRRRRVGAAALAFLPERPGIPKTTEYFLSIVFGTFLYEIDGAGLICVNSMSLGGYVLYWPSTVGVNVPRPSASGRLLRTASGQYKT